ncbi:CoA transferase [Mycolicibacterium sp. 018/SC-01/001]|uniref:CoA transferase n=1 Tax=Mycolicibacterium sp. 018/SC-01/001 TaxID=2592069 RepID=UPI00117F9290|nr:CoA transferase [Mycolicibacterium sp. 018/SC-01/001]TRW79656.1 CoA transferase [Mycolicibacterium sp. 018/SC-01/001]
MASLTIDGAVLAAAAHRADTVSSIAGIPIDAAELIAGRVALLRLAPAGTVSAGGATRLMAARDGWCALTLARADDVDAVPALVEHDVVERDPWQTVRNRLRQSGVHEFAERARLLGLPVGVLGETAPAAPTVRVCGRRETPGSLRDVLVADLSSMWAGPLCGRLLAGAGATVVKVESRRRPDGTRAGPRPFFDWVNAGKLSYAADFDEPEQLVRLLSVADVVLESSRPAALARRGLGPDIMPARDGRIWLQITGHGAAGEKAHWVAFGDDAAVSGGLVGGTAGAPTFCGDAIADPLTGLEAAAAVLDAHRRGGGEVITVAMAAVAAHYAALPVAGDVDCTATAFDPDRAARLGEHNALVDRIVAERAVTAC